MSNETPFYHFDNIYFEKPLRFQDISLLQIGRRYCRGGDIVQPHMHENWFEITLITAGHGVALTNKKECLIKAKDIHLSFPYEIHEIRSSQEDFLQYDYFSFICENGSLADDLKKNMLDSCGGYQENFSRRKNFFFI